jgi:hypothetical protein
MKDLCSRNHGGAETSIAAYETTPESHREAIRLKVLGMVEASAAFGLTCDEAEATTGLPHQSISARFTELVAAKQIHYGKERRKTRSGKQARVYFAGPSTEAYFQKDLFAFVVMLIPSCLLGF